MQRGLTTRLHPTTGYFPIIFLFLFSGTSLLSQSTVKGKVVDESGGSPEYASMLLLQSFDSSLVKGATLSPEGSYHFVGINPGKYLVATSMVGYQPAFSELLF